MCNGCCSTREAAVADCMRSQGFDYQAWVDPAMVPDSGPAITRTAEYEVRLVAARERGFGFSGAVSSPPVPSSPNPNDVIQANLDEAEAAAWRTALYGELTLSERTAGCIEAEVSVPDGYPDEEIRSLESAFGSIVAAVEDSADYAAAAGAARECIGSNGYAVAGLAEAMELAANNAQSWADDNQAPPGVLQSGQALEDLEPWWDQASLDALIAAEIDLAVSVLECERDTTVQVYDRLVAEASAEFVNTHIGELLGVQELLDVWLERNGASGIS